MNNKVTFKILSAIIAFSGLIMSETTSAKKASAVKIHVVNQIIPPRSCPPRQSQKQGVNPLTPEKKLELQKQKLDFEYEKTKLDEEKNELDIESQSIKSELKMIFEQIENEQDSTSSHDFWTEKLESCLEKRRLYREKLKTHKSKFSDWKIRKENFVKEVLNYDPDKDLPFGTISVYTWLEG